MDNDQAVLRLIETWAALMPEITTYAPDAVLTLVTEQAVKAISTAEAASISRARRDAGFETVASTDPLATEADAIQFAVGSGPCVDAAVQTTVFLCGDLRTDDRWPEFARRASAAGVISMLAVQLFTENDSHPSALNLYSRQAEAFDEHDRLSALALATYGALAVVGARHQNRVVNLERALASNRDIGVAIGVLMGLHRITRDQAFDLLRMASQARHRKLAEIARNVAETGSLDPV